MGDESILDSWTSETHKIFAQADFDESPEALAETIAIDSDEEYSENQWDEEEIKRFVTCISNRILANPRLSASKKWRKLEESLFRAKHRIPSALMEKLRR